MQIFMDYYASVSNDFIDCTFNCFGETITIEGFDFIINEILHS
jgi:hypothetical protein